MPNPEHYRDNLEEILGREKFMETEPGFLESVAGSLSNITGDILAQFGVDIFLVLGFMGTLLLLGLIIWVMRRHRFPVEREGGIKEPAAAGGHSPETAMWRSKEEARSGSHAEALRYLLLSLLLRLEEEGEIEYHQSYTNGEYIKQLRSGNYPGLTLVKEIIRLYEMIWYGKCNCREQDYEQGLQLYRRLQEARR